jgi:hypothetical protein
MEARNVIIIAAIIVAIIAPAQGHIITPINATAVDIHAEEIGDGLVIDGHAELVKPHQNATVIVEDAYHIKVQHFSIPELVFNQRVVIID